MLRKLIALIHNPLGCHRQILEELAVCLTAPYNAVKTGQLCSC